MSKNNETEVKSCVHCGANVNIEQVYCPECGKLAIEPKSSGKILNKPTFSRKCTGCGSIIETIKLEQCPICNAILDKVPEHVKPSPKKESGFIFNDGNKFQPDLNKEFWNLKEGLQTFQMSIIIYIFFMISIFLLYINLANPSTQEIEKSIFTILLDFMPYISLGLYPIFYIIIKKNYFIKLGFLTNQRKIRYALIIGGFGAILLLIYNLFSNMAFDSLVNAGISNFINYNNKIIETQQIIRDSGIWLILYMSLIILSSISKEILFRGVLQNTLKQKFGNSLKGKIIIILMISVIYAGIEGILILFVDIFIGLFFIISYFIFFTILGILYEINGNLYNTIIAHVIFNILVVITTIYF